MTNRTFDKPNPSALPEDTDEFNALDSDTLDLEIALLATTAGQDAGEPTETVDLATLSHTEKQTLLALLRRNLGVEGTGENGATREEAA